MANILEHEKTCTRRAQDGQDQEEDESDGDEDEQEEEEEDVGVMIVPNRAEAVFKVFANAMLFGTAILFLWGLFLFYYKLVFLVFPRIHHQI